eukprot:3439620-Pyramimonas_sp.AAC.1
MAALLRGRGTARSASPRRHEDSGQADAKTMRTGTAGEGSMGAGAADIAQREAAQAEDTARQPTGAEAEPAGKDDSDSELLAAVAATSATAPVFR